MKCLPTSKLSLAQGNVLHDSHAEIVATRAFNRFLIDECRRITDHAGISSFVRLRNSEEMTAFLPQAFTIDGDVSIHMYSSEAPCGDASMELIIATQEDATPWELPASAFTGHDDHSAASPGLLKGRGSFAELGIVRRKPARPDAPPTLSKSCTDKLTMYQFTSVLGSLASLLICPVNAYISTLTMPQSQCVDTAITRAFTTAGRLQHLSTYGHGHWASGSGYAPHYFQVQTTTLEFTWSRRSAAAAAARSHSFIPSNITAVYTPYIQETLINGVLQGRKMFDPKGASAISRRAMWMAVEDLLPEILQSGAQTYGEVKNSDACRSRRAVKEDVRRLALPAWVRNLGDDAFQRG